MIKQLGTDTEYVVHVVQMQKCRHNKYIAVCYYIYIYLLLASSLYRVRGVEEGGHWAGVRMEGRHDKLAEAAQLLLLPIFCPPRLQNTTH